MLAMVLKQQRMPLVYEEISLPACSPDYVLIRVLACGVCRTDLHVCDGDLVEPKLPLVPGHEITGEIVECGTAVTGLKTGQRVGVPWLGYTCGQCQYCREGHENLCDNARFTGYHVDGGYAEYTLAHQNYVFPLPDTVSPVATAPLLCAGLIGYRSLNMAGTARRLGIYGFGAAAHIITQVAVYQGREVYAFTRTGDSVSQAFAKTLGAVWAGDSEQNPSELLDAAIIFAPVGDLVPRALSVVKKGGIIVCAGIHMTDIPAFPYFLLWGERSIKSVANLTRQDGEEFLALAARIPVQTETESFPLQDANKALDKLRKGEIKGAAVLVMR
jgi:propanol-preferring alcohol dehydrogenase